MMRYVFVAVAIGAAFSRPVPGILAPRVNNHKLPHRRRLLLRERFWTSTASPATTSAAKTANVTFDTMDLANLSKDAKIWERAVRKLRGGMMPPPGARQPDRAAVEAFATWLENSLDQAAAADPNPGRRRGASAESRGVCQCDRGHSGVARRSQRTASRRRRQQRLRQHRQRSESFSVVSRSIYIGGPDRDDPGDWRNVRQSAEHQPSHAGGDRSERSH